MFIISVARHYSCRCFFIELEAVSMGTGSPRLNPLSFVSSHYLEDDLLNSFRRWNFDFGAPGQGHPFVAASLVVLWKW